MLNGDTRLYTVADTVKKILTDLFDTYYIFPNIYSGKIITGEGDFECESYFTDENDTYPIFKTERNKYRWNTFILLKKQ